MISNTNTSYVLLAVTDWPLLTITDHELSSLIWLSKCSKYTVLNKENYYIIHNLTVIHYAFLFCLSHISESVVSMTTVSWGTTKWALLMTVTMPHLPIPSNHTDQLWFICSLWFLCVWCSVCVPVHCQASFSVGRVSLLIMEGKGHFLIVGVRHD